VPWLFSQLGVAALWADDKPKPAFDALLAKVKRSDPKADFQQLRMAFTRTSDYKPYDTDANKIHEQMRNALQKQDYEQAIQLAEKVLKTKYVDLHAHLVAYRAYSELNKGEQAKYHRYVYDGLLESILKSANARIRSMLTWSSPPTKSMRS
jgi:Domain of unknown function (DUF4919)